MEEGRKMKRFNLGMILITTIILAGCGSSGGDTYTTNEAPLPEMTPTDGTNIMVSAEGESSVGLSYTNVSDGSILVSCGDNCDLSVNEASPVITDTEGGQGECEDGFFWCPIENKCLPNAEG